MSSCSCPSSIPAGISGWISARGSSRLPESSLAYASSASFFSRANRCFSCSAFISAIWLAWFCILEGPDGYVGVGGALLTGGGAPLGPPAEPLGFAFSLGSSSSESSKAPMSGFLFDDFALRFEASSSGLSALRFFSDFRFS